GHRLCRAAAGRGTALHDILERHHCRHEGSGGRKVADQIHHRARGGRCLQEARDGARLNMSMSITRRFALRFGAAAGVAAALAAALPSPPASAQGAAHNWPARFVRLIVPYPAGGGADAIARLVGAKLSEMWGQQVTIENRGGAGGNLASEAAA